jgi:hypothetical protein
MRRIVLACLTATLTGLATVHAQAVAPPRAPAAAEATELIVPLNTLLGTPGKLRTIQVVRAIDANGQIQTSPSDAIPESQLRFMGWTEGYSVVLVADPESGQPRAVLRGQIVDVGPRASLTIQIDPHVGDAVRVGDGLVVARPLGATTAQLRGLPGRIPIETPRAPVDVDPRQTAARAKSVENLKRIGLALLNYESAHQTFPPAVIVGPDGKPWHSWRVLILPYLEHEALFKTYDFRQPWNSEKNRALLDQMPDVFRDPIHGDAKDHVTHYAAFVGPRAGFVATGAIQPEAPGQVPLNKGLGIANFTDGTSNTILVGSVDPARKIAWTQPEDIAVGPNTPRDMAPIGKPEGLATPYTQEGKVDGLPVGLVLFADGSVRGIASSINPQVFAALQTRAGGEVISVDAIPGDRPPTPPLMGLVIRVENGKTTATLEPIDPARLLGTSPR